MIAVVDDLGMGDDVALRLVREADLPMLEELTQDPERRASSSGSGGLILGAGGATGTKMA